MFSETNSEFCCQDYKCPRNLDRLIVFYSYNYTASTNYATNYLPSLPKNKNLINFIHFKVYHNTHFLPLTITMPNITKIHFLCPTT